MARGTDRQRRGRRRRRSLAVGCVAVAAAVAAATVWATDGSASPAYRTATASNSSVTKTLDVSGTLEPVKDASVGFQVGGTVASVNVSVGQHVNAGQVMASLDPTALQAAVTSAQSLLTADQAKLSEDEAGQATTVSSVTGTGAATTSSLTGPPTLVLTAATTSSSDAALKAAQQAVVKAQQTADADIQTAAADLANAETVCSATGTSTTGDGTTTSTTTAAAPTTSTSTPRSTTTSTTTPPATSGSNPSQDCADALSTAMTAQSQVSTDQKAVDSAENSLAEILTSMASSSSAPGSSSGGTGKNGSGTSGGTGAGGTTGTSGGAGVSGTAGRQSGTTSSPSNAPSSTTRTATDTATQLATDQASIDSATAALVENQQALGGAQLASPLAGTVASVGISADQSVNASSTSDTITVINSGGYETTSSLTSAQVSQVTAGDQVQVSVNGTSASLAGTVSRVGPVNVSGTSYTYPLVVALASGTSAMAAGSTAQVHVDVAKVTNTLVVPTSAVHTSSPGRASVLVFKSGKEVQTKVSVGVVGDVYTQITSGLTEGEKVVLADPSQALPSSSTNSTRPTFGAAGGFPGGGVRPTGG